MPGLTCPEKEGQEGDQKAWGDSILPRKDPSLAHHTQLSPEVILTLLCGHTLRLPGSAPIQRDRPEDFYTHKDHIFFD